MSRRGRSKGKVLADESSSREESGWQGMRIELRNLVHRISHAFSKSGSSGSSGDPWLRQLSKLRAPMFKGKGGPEESEAWLRRIENILDSKACSVEHWVQLVVYPLEGDADQWWKSVRQLKFPESVTVEIK